VIKYFKQEDGPYYTKEMQKEKKRSNMNMCIMHRKTAKMARGAGDAVARVFVPHTTTSSRAVRVIPVPRDGRP
jgi:phosphoserine aminotransferase